MLGSDDTRFDSWKAIADYLGRDLRTVARWEKEKALPVRRLPGGRRRAVYAYRSEIDAWLRDAHVESDENGGSSSQPLHPGSQVTGSPAPALDAEGEEQNPVERASEQRLASSAPRAAHQPLWWRARFAGLAGFGALLLATLFFLRARSHRAMDPPVSDAQFPPVLSIGCGSAL
jgi:hypothetical protein